MTAPMLPLNDGNALPAIGLGTVGLRHAEGVTLMENAISAGYRLVDTAMNYNNEHEVGDALRRSGVNRDEVKVTTKLPGRHHGFDTTIESLEQSRTALGLDYVDLYLIHWPNPSRDLSVESWKAMIRLQQDGTVRSIGVSNFTREHLTRLIDETGVTPAVNQVELHPNFPQGELRAFHADHGIVTESWSPLGRGEALTAEQVIRDAAAAHGVTATQVVLRWHTQLGAIPVPKSANPARQKENLDIFGFELTDDEVAAISALQSGRLWNGDPETHEEM